MERVEAEKAEGARAAEIREGKFEAAFQTASIPMTISRLSDGALLEVNDAQCSEFGYDRAEMIGRTTIELGILTPREREGIVAAVQDHGVVRDFELTFRRRDGAARRGLLSGTRIDVDGEACLVASMIDMTARRAAEEALRASEERFRNLVEQTVDGLLLLDEEGRIVDANPALARLLGRSIDELLGRQWTDYIDPQSLAELPFQRPTLADEAIVFERRLRRSDGSTVEVEVHTRPFAGGGLLGTARDIGARKAAERERARLIGLASAVAALDATLRVAQDEGSVFRGATRLLVSVGGVAVAFVGLAEPAGRGLNIYAVDCDEKRLDLGAGTSGNSLRPPDEIFSRALETGRPQVHRTGDAEPSDTWSAALTGLGVESAAIIPICVGDFAVGIIGILADAPGFFGDPEVNLLQQVGSLIGMRLGDIERHERELALAAALESERAEAERFAAMTATIERSLERVSKTDELFREACRLPVDLGVCVVARFGLEEADMKGRRLRFVASVARDAHLERETDAWLGRRVPFSYTGHPPAAVPSTMVVNDVLNDPRFRRRHQVLREAGLRAMVVLPVFSGSCPAGSMAFYAQEVGAFGPQEVALLDRLAVNVGHRLAAIESERDRRLAQEKIARLLSGNASNASAESGPRG